MSVNLCQICYIQQFFCNSFLTNVFWIYFSFFQGESKSHWCHRSESVSVVCGFCLILSLLVSSYHLFASIGRFPIWLLPVLFCWYSCLSLGFYSFVIFLISFSCSLLTCFFFHSPWLPRVFIKSLGLHVFFAESCCCFSFCPCVSRDLCKGWRLHNNFSNKKTSNFPASFLGALKNRVCCYAVFEHVSVLIFIFTSFGCLIKTTFSSLCLPCTHCSTCYCEHNLILIFVVSNSAAWFDY